MSCRVVERAAVALSRAAAAQHQQREAEAEADRADRRDAGAGRAADRALVEAGPADAAAHAVVAAAELARALARLARLDAVLRAVVVGALPGPAVRGGGAARAEPAGDARAGDAAAANAGV